MPLFLAGDQQERRFAREHPTITVDGCDKLCAKRGTEQYSGQVAASLVVTEILGERLSNCHRSERDFDRSDEEAVGLLADRIAAKVDLFAGTPAPEPGDGPGQTASCGCSCGKPIPEGTLVLGNWRATINGLPLIFGQLFRQGLGPDNCTDQLLETVRIYHEIPASEEHLYRQSLPAAYQEYCRRQLNGG